MGFVCFEEKTMWFKAHQAVQSEYCDETKKNPSFDGFFAYK